jgi:hypothetical protein
MGTVVATAPGTGKRKQSPPSRQPGDPPFFELSRLMVVALKGSGNVLVYKAQTKPNGPWESAWTPVGPSQPYRPMTAGITGDGRVGIVAQRASDNGLSYIVETPDAVGVEQWDPPVDLGKPPGGSAFLYLAMAVDADARLDVFGSDDRGGRIWWKYQNPSRIVQKTVTVTPPGTTTPITVTVDEVAPPLTPWSDWFQLPGALGRLAASRSADGRVILFGINEAGHLYRSEQRVARALQPSDWSSWVRMDDAATGEFVAMAPALDAAGAMNLFAINRGNQILHTRQAPPNTSTWAGWSTPGYIREGVRGMAAGVDGDDHLVLVATDATNLHNANQQESVNPQQWSGWNPFQATSKATALRLDYNSDGRLTLFSHWLEPSPPFGGVWCISQMGINSTEWELSWTELAANDIRQYAVVRDLTPPAA